MVVIEFIIYVVKGFFYELLLKGIWALIRGRPFVLRGWQLRNTKAEAGLIILDHRASQKDLFWNSFASPKDLLLLQLPRFTQETSWGSFWRREVSERVASGFLRSTRRFETRSLNFRASSWGRRLRS